MTTGERRRTMPAPIVNAESQPFWDAAQERKLLFKHCGACGKSHFFPRTLCPFCFSDETEWREASGTGTLYAHSTLRRGAPEPYTLAYVTLAEGPHMLTNIVDGEDSALTIGQAVKLVFRPAENGMLVPLWTPA